MYPFTRGRAKATLLFRVEDPDRAEHILAEHGVNLVPSAELYARAAR